MPPFMPVEPGQHERIIALADRLLKPLADIFEEVGDFLLLGVSIPGTEIDITMVELLFGYGLFMYLLLKIGTSVK